VDDTDGAVERVVEMLILVEGVREGIKIVDAKK
jgi:hypothetical protein